MSAVVGYGPFLLYGFFWTVAVSIAALVVGMVFGLLGCLGRLSRYRILRLAAAGYVIVFQSLPELLVVLIVYFSGEALLRQAAEFLAVGTRVEISPFIAGAFALALAMGAYVTDVLRSAYLQVPHGQKEAANALGLTPRQRLYLVEAPQILRLAMPALGNLFLVVQKNSALVSVIGLTEVMRQSQIAAGATHDALTFYAVAGILYLVLAGATIVIQAVFEARLARGMA